MNDKATQAGNENRPLNLTQEELSYLWDMIQQEVGDPDVQYGPNRDVVESIHTKIHDLKGVESGPTTESDGGDR